MWGAVRLEGKQKGWVDEGSSGVLESCHDHSKNHFNRQRERDWVSQNRPKGKSRWETIK